MLDVMLNWGSLNLIIRKISSQDWASKWGGKKPLQYPLNWSIITSQEVTWLGNRKKNLKSDSCVVFSMSQERGKKEMSTHHSNKKGSSFKNYLLCFEITRGSSCN